jgi:hypothetical protein
MTLPVAYPAASQAIDDFLATVAQLRPHGFIPAQEILAQPRGRATYGLEPATAAVAFELGGARTELRFGAATLGEGGVYVQRVGSDGVHIVRSRILEQLPQTAMEWRTRLLFEPRETNWSRFAVRSGALGYELRRNPTNALWRLAKPSSMRANHPRVENLIQLLQNAEVTGFVSDGTTLGLEAYGLEPPRLEFVLGDATNDWVTVRFGSSPTNQPGLVYAYLGNSKSVVLVPRSLGTVLALTPKDLLDPRLISFAPESVDRIEAIARERFSLARQAGGTWRVVEPREFPADSLLVQEFLGRLNQLEVLEVEKDVVTELDFPRYGFAPTNWQYTARANLTNSAEAVTNALVAQLQFGTNEQDRVYVRRSDESAVYAVRASETDLLPQVALQFRDRRVFDFATNEVTGLTVKAKDQVYKWVRSANHEWIPQAGSAAAPVALGEVLFPEVLFRLGQLQAEFWVAQGEAHLARFGLATNAHQLTVEFVQRGQTHTATLDLAGQSPLLAPFAAVRLPDQPERVGFAFRFWFYEPYRQILQELKVPLPEGGG